jgi:hypothetical protein
MSTNQNNRSPNGSFLFEEKPHRGRAEELLNQL